MNWKDAIPLVQYGISGIIYFAMSYITLHFKVKQIVKQINGLGSKLTELDKKLSSTNESVRYVEGYMDAKFTRKPKSGNA